MITRDEFEVNGRFVIELDVADARELHAALDGWARGGPTPLADDLTDRLSGWLAAVEDDEEDPYSELDVIVGLTEQGESPEGSHHAP